MVSKGVQFVGIEDGMVRGLRSFMLAAALLWSGAGQGLAAEETVKIGTLRFGSASWVIDTIRAHGFDKARDLTIEETPLANNEGAKIALSTGAVDMIVSDWVWVARQRAAGEKLSFIPYSSMVGAILVPKDSSIKTFADLKGRKIGIVGGPLDKNWIFMRALALRDLHIDLDQATERVFGAPPLLNEQLRSGRLDAVLTNWNFAARLEADGYRRVISVKDALKSLGVGDQIPLVGYVFKEDWGRAHAGLLKAFFAASLDAAHVLDAKDDEWQRLLQATGAESPAILGALRDSYREGIPRAWGAAERAATAKAFQIMVDIGGQELVGSSSQLDPATFWDGVTF